MKILKIFGLVVGIHAVVFLFVFAIPGCRSTGNTVPAGDTAATSVAPAPAFNPDTPARPRPLRPDAPAASLPPPVPVAVAVVAPAPPPPAPAETYTVKNGDNLWSLARKNNLTAAELAAANGISVSSVLRPGQKLQLPQKSAAAVSAAATPVADPAGTTGYVVKNGETLGSIASRHRTTVAALRTLNGLRSDTIRAGDRLRVPVTPGGGAAAAAATPSAAPAAGDGLTHTVKAGEKLSDIAKTYGVRQRDIEVTNNLTNPNSLRAGLVLKIPGYQVPPPSRGPVSAAPPPPAAAPVTAAPPPPSEALPSLPTLNFGPPPAAASAAPPPPRSGPTIQIEDGGAPRIRQDGAR